MTQAARTLLCIEDDREVAKLIVEEITDRGFKILIAHDGHEGLVAILKRIPHLVLCDIGLPLLSGIELLERSNELPPGECRSSSSPPCAIEKTSCEQNDWA
jgi:DNA-binding response OmpR family regulator